MAQRFYLTNAAASFTPATRRGAWDDTSSTLVRSLGAATSGANVAATGTETSVTGSWDVLLGRWVSETTAVVGGGVLQGTMTLVGARNESSFSLNAHTHVHAYVCVGATDVVRGTLIADDIDTPEWPTQLTVLGDTITLNPVTVVAGDRIVIELGFQGQNTSSTSMTGTWRYGGTGDADVGDNGSGTLTDSPWIDFSDTGGVLRAAITTNQTVTESSTSADAVTTFDSLTSTAGAETSTSTDSALVSWGRGITETSTSTDSLGQTGTVGRFLAESSETTDNVYYDFARADIDNYEFVIVDPVTNSMTPFVPFGGGQVIRGTFSPGSFEVVNQDANGVVSDYRMFGTDLHTAPTWNWSLFTDTYTPEEGLAWLEVFKGIWNNKVRRTPEGVLALRYMVGGRARRVHGRPRRFTPIPDAIQRGKIHIECDFDLAEDVYYDDDEASVETTLSASVSTSAGIILPQPLPWVFTTPAPPRTLQAIVGGSQATWVDIDFHGPSSNPWVKIGNLTWGLTGSLLLGEKITLSGKPWSMGVRRPDGTNLPGWLDPRSRLSALQIDPGTYSVQYGGWDNTGTGKAVVRWRPAHQTL